MSENSLNDSYIKIDHLSLEFPLYHGGSRSLKKTLFVKAGRMLTKQKRQHQRTGGDVVFQENDPNQILIQALHDINLDIRAGERVGLVGHNGAGKSTLLRTMAGIYEPAHGHIQTRGNIDALLDPNAGMNPALSGRENIFLRGKRLGFSKEQIRHLEKDVEEFAELNEFMDLPVRIYSSGMAMRLGFGLSTATTPKILLLDEWFMAGDSVFQEKAAQRLENIVQSAEIVVLTTHYLPAVRSWCQRLIWLEAGRIIADGPVDTLLDRYIETMEADI